MGYERILKKGITAYIRPALITRLTARGEDERGATGDDDEIIDFRYAIGR